MPRGNFTWALSLNLTRFGLGHLVCCQYASKSAGFIKWSSSSKSAFNLSTIFVSALIPLPLRTRDFSFGGLYFRIQQLAQANGDSRLVFGIVPRRSCDVG